MIIRSILDRANKVLTLIAGAAIIVMMLQIVADSMLRTLFNSNLPGTLEIVSYYYMVAVTFLPLAYIQQIRGHVIIELFTMRLKPRAIAGIECVVFLLGALGMAYFCYATFQRAMAMTALNEYAIGTIIVTTWPSRWFVVAGTGMMSIYLFLHTIDEGLVALGLREPTPVSEQQH